MAGTRALFASIGASVALVAAAALTLLAVSAVFAFGGWGDFASPPGERPALVFASATTADTRTAEDGGRASRIVAPAPVRTASAERPRSSSPARDAARPAAPTGVDTSSQIGPRVDDPPSLPRTTPPPPPPPPSQPTTGDRVTKAGATLSGTVQSTGAALAEVTEPLAAPVSAAVQQVLNLVAEAVRRTAEGLGGTVDALLAPKR